VKIIRCIAACAALVMGPAADALAQAAYPSRPVRLVIPYPPGGSTDGLARIVIPRVSESIGQQVVIDNRGGAGGIIGTSLVAKAPADGYTWLMVFDVHAVNPFVYGQLPYSTFKDFAPVTLVAASPVYLIVHPGVPSTDVKQFVALARSRPGELQFASAGAGSSNHLAGELFKQVTGVDLMHVAYKGGGPAQIALMGGEVRAMFGSASFSAPLVRSGRVRALGVAGAKRNAALPDVPTFAEQGFGGFDFSTWFGVFAPAGTPDALVRRWQQEMAKAMRIPEVERRLTDLGVEIAASSPEEFDRYFRREAERMGKIIRERNISVEQ